MFLFLACGLTAGKCTDSEDPTEEDDDDDDDDEASEEIPDEVDDFFDEEQREALEDVGMVIHTGDDPPDIEGTYFLDAIEIIYDDSDTWLDIVDYTYVFFDQTNDGEISMNYEAPDANDVAEGVGAFISGSGDCFSIFLDTEGVANGCEYKLPGIISGCLDDSGITDWQNGFIMGEKSGDNCDLLMPTDHRRIIEETDDLAEEIDKAFKAATSKGSCLMAIE